MERFSREELPKPNFGDWLEQFIPGFEEQLLGMNIGDEREIGVTFPKNTMPGVKRQGCYFRG